MAVKSFAFYSEYYELITLLNEEEQKELSLAILNYMFDDKKPNLNANQMKIFKNLKRPLDKSKNKSKATSNQNQNDIKLKSNENQIEIKLKSNENQNKNTSDVNVIVNVNVNNIINFIENNFNRTISSYELEQIKILVDKYSNEIVLYAFQKTLEAGKKSLNYTKGILKNWESDKLDSLEKIKEQEKGTEKPSTISDEESDLIENYDWLNEN